MKKLALLFLLLTNLSVLIHAQIQNPSFEENGEASLDGWLNNLCNYGDSENDAAPNAGQWCVKMQPGQTQGCFPGFFYQELPNVTNGQVFQLNGWAKVDEDGPVVGIYLGRKNAVSPIQLFDGDTTSSQDWTMLNVMDTFELAPGDFAVVVINSGLVGGPIGPSHSSYFDDIHLELVTSIDEAYFDELKIFPNPVIGSHLFIELDPLKIPIDDLSVYDIMGKIVFKHTGYLKSINVADWDAGIYCIKLRSGEKEIIKKVIIN